jgi:hypothetical protein
MDGKCRDIWSEIIPPRIVVVEGDAGQEVLL